MGSGGLRWPWTSRARLDDALEQVAHLRAECAKLTEAMTRIGRREVGLPETPRQPRPAPEPIPEELERYIRGFENRSVRANMRQEALLRRVQGTPWAEITRDAMKVEEPNA